MKASLICAAAFAMLSAGTIAAETGAPQSLVSVSQFTDVQPPSPYYEALQSLVERYGVANGFKGPAGVAFRGDTELSRADMIMLIEGALDQVSQLAELTVMEMPPEKQQGALRSLSIMQGAKCKSMGAKFESVSQIKDVKPNDAWYAAAQSLTEKWSVRIASPDGTFGARDPVSVAEARECLKLFSPKGPAHAPAKLTRGGFAVMLNEVLNTFAEELASLN